LGGGGGSSEKKGGPAPFITFLLVQNWKSQSRGKDEWKILGPPWDWWYSPPKHWQEIKSTEFTSWLTIDP
jgi:hypothetical protein